MLLSPLLFAITYLVVLYVKVEPRLKRFCRRIDRFLLRANRVVVEQRRRVFLW